MVCCDGVDDEKGPLADDIKKVKDQVNSDLDGKLTSISKTLSGKIDDQLATQKKEVVDIANEVCPWADDEFTCCRVGWRVLGPFELPCPW